MDATIIASIFKAAHFIESKTFASILKWGKAVDKATISTTMPAIVNNHANVIANAHAIHAKIYKDLCAQSRLYTRQGRISLEDGSMPLLAKGLRMYAESHMRVFNVNVPKKNRKVSVSADHYKQALEIFDWHALQAMFPCERANFTLASDFRRSTEGTDVEGLVTFEMKNMMCQIFNFMHCTVTLFNGSGYANLYKIIGDLLSSTAPSFWTDGYPADLLCHDVRSMADAEDFRASSAKQGKHVNGSIQILCHKDRVSTVFVDKTRLDEYNGGMRMERSYTLNLERSAGGRLLA